MVIAPIRLNPVGAPCIKLRERPWLRIAGNSWLAAQLAYASNSRSNMYFFEAAKVDTKIAGPFESNR